MPNQLFRTKIVMLPSFRPTLYIEGLAQDYSNSIANALDLLQSCSKPIILSLVNLDTVKPVCNDHLYDKIYFLWFIQ